MVLVAALCDLDRGIVPPLVKKADGVGQIKQSFGFMDVRRKAAATMQGLMHTGLERENAARAVTKSLNLSGLPQTNARAVKDWFDEMITFEAEEAPAQERRARKRN
jgi:hypothetical protein